MFQLDKEFYIELIKKHRSLHDLTIFELLINYRCFIKVRNRESFVIKLLLQNFKQ